MNRSGGVAVIAVLALLGSLFCLAMGCIMGLTLLFGPVPKAIDPVAQSMAKLGMIFGTIFFFVPAVWGIASSIGLFRLKSWARISTLIFSGLLIFFGLASPLFVLAIPMPPPPNVDPSVMTGIKIAIAGFYLSLAAIGAWWMVFLTRPVVKSQFQAGGVPAPPPRRPLSISIIAWFLLIATCGVPFNMALHFPMMLFGAMFTGWAANLLLILFGAVGITAGIGLLRLRPYARLLSIVYFIFGLMNAAATWLLPGSAERVAKMFEAMLPFFRTQPHPSFNPLIMFAIMFSVTLLPLYFLVKHKLAFDAPVPTPEPPPPPLAAGAAS